MRLLSLSTAIVLAAGAMTLPMAAPAQADARLQERFYDPNEVVTIRGRARVQATIQFGDGETIENVAVGDSTAWQITPNKRANLLFVKPLSASASTNMTVVTNKHTYLFDLVASPKHRPLYVLRFTYPKAEVDPEEEARLAVLAAGANPPETANSMELQAARDPYAVVDPARLNFAWTGTGAVALLPDETYDDGAAVFLKWAAGKAVPAILTRNEAGEEGPVNFTVRGETVVVQDVPRELILRTGDETAKLVNTGPDRSAKIEPLPLPQSTNSQETL
ncbi:MAG: TrbG/VirB9 family P-type conjugative transfer protein [Erythrobacter sp.]